MNKREKYVVNMDICVVANGKRKAVEIVQGQISKSDGERYSTSDVEVYSQYTKVKKVKVVPWLEKQRGI